MKSSTIFLSCALLAILIAQLPTGQAATCEDEPNNPDCVDCSNPINEDDAECVDDDEVTTTTIAPTTVASGSSSTVRTTRGTRPTRRGSRRPGWGRPGWGRPGWGRPGWGRPGWGRPGWRRRRRTTTTTARPRTILGNIIQKKIDFLNRMKQPRQFSG